MRIKLFGYFKEESNTTFQKAYLVKIYPVELIAGSQSYIPINSKPINISEERYNCSLKLDM